MVLDKHLAGAVEHGSWRGTGWRRKSHVVPKVVRLQAPVVPEMLEEVEHVPWQHLSGAGITVPVVDVVGAAAEELAGRDGQCHGVGRDRRAQ